MSISNMPPIPDRTDETAQSSGSDQSSEPSGEASSTTAPANAVGAQLTGAIDDQPSKPGLFSWFKGFRRPRSNGNGSVRDTLEELIEEHEEAQVPFGEDERTLLQNIMTVRQKTVADVMVPRVDITAIEAGTPKKEIIKLIGEQGHSRLPVYRETLDDVIGMIHIKDLLTWSGKRTFRLSEILRKVLFVAPSMQVLELLLEMRVTRSHMALVVDEFGGVDGLVTIEDLVEEIVGEIDDEHDVDDDPTFSEGANGSLVADARVPIDALEEKLGPVITDEEREDIDTLGGLVFTLLGRVPIRGELVTHPSGWEFEILEADPRRVRKLCVRRPGNECMPATLPASAETLGAIAIDMVGDESAEGEPSIAAVKSRDAG